MATFPTNELAPNAASVTFRDEFLVVHLTDGREISIPLAWFPRLQAATPQQREQWELMGGGVGIHWEEIDEDISVPRLLGLPCE
jgi:hypothetical protein